MAQGRVRTRALQSAHVAVLYKVAVQRLSDMRYWLLSAGHQGRVGGKKSFPDVHHWEMRTGMVANC